MSVNTKCLLPSISENDVISFLKTIFSVDDSHLEYGEEIYSCSGFIGIENTNMSRDIFLINIPKIKKYSYKERDMIFKLKDEFDFVDDSVKNIIYLSMGCDYESQYILSILTVQYKGWLLADDSASTEYLKVSKHDVIITALS